MRAVATPPVHPSGEGNWQCRCIYAVTFAVFLPAVVLQRLLPARWRLLPVAGKRQSVFAETRAVTSTIIPFAFMV